MVRVTRSSQKNCLLPLEPPSLYPAHLLFLIFYSSSSILHLLFLMLLEILFQSFPSLLQGNQVADKDCEGDYDVLDTVIHSARSSITTTATMSTRSSIITKTTEVQPRDFYEDEDYAQLNQVGGAGWWRRGKGVELRAYLKVGKHVF